MKNFRLPRKIKKSLKGNIWLYPPDEKGNSLMARPATSREDYIAWKQGIVKSLFDRENSEKKQKQRESLDKEVTVSDETLRQYVDNIFRKDFRIPAYNTLIAAKNNPKAIIAYYNFINAYHLNEEGESSYGNICCLSIDRAKALLKKTRSKKRRRNGK